MAHTVWGCIETAAIGRRNPLYILKAKISSSIKFSNRSDPKRQLEASNQFYSLLWSKKASLQTVIDNLLTHGINNQNEDISSGIVLFQYKATHS